MSTPTRQPAGTPAGGQFAATGRTEPAVDLEVATPSLEQVAASVRDRYGSVAEHDVLYSKPVYAAELAEYADRLPTLSDTEFVEAAADAIYSSSNMARFNGFEHLHARATMVYAESGRRHAAAGHAKDCGGLTLYDRGYNRAVVDAGHRSMVTGPKPCTCGAAG